jgi:hypothetical protein
VDAVLQQLEAVLARLAQIESSIGMFVHQQPAKKFYTTAEVATILDRAEWTVREWCRLGRVHAEKRPCGRGTSQEWIVSREELERIQNEGLLPDPRIIRRRMR